MFNHHTSTTTFAGVGQPPVNASTAGSKLSGENAITEFHPGNIDV